jgi:hypothetical protein
MTAAVFLACLGVAGLVLVGIVVAWLVVRVSIAFELGEDVAERIRRGTRSNGGEPVSGTQPAGVCCHCGVYLIAGLPPGCTASPAGEHEGTPFRDQFTVGGQ